MSYHHTTKRPTKFSHSHLPFNWGDSSHCVTIKSLHYVIKKTLPSTKFFLSAVLPYITWGKEVTWCYSSSHLTCSCVTLVVITDCRSLSLWHWDVVQWHMVHAKFCENWSLVQKVDTQRLHFTMVRRKVGLKNRFWRCEIEWTIKEETDPKEGSGIWSADLGLCNRRVDY
jgi:hypothetical protein